MYSRRKLLCLSASLLLAVSCTEKKGDVLYEAAENYDIVLSECIDETPAYSCTNLLADEFCDLEFIPLENNSEYPLGEMRNVQACDSGLYIMDNQEGRSLFYYRLDGSFVSKIGGKGHSRAEYTDMLYFSANTAGDTVAIVDYDYVKFYDSNGKFLKEESLKGSHWWQGFLYTDKGFILSHSNRGQKTVLAQYSDDFKTEHPVIEGHVNLISDMPSSWENLVRRNGERICYYDYYTSTFYIFNLEDMSDSKRFTLHSPNGVTESKVRDAGMNSADLDHLVSYVYEDSTIWGRFKYGEYSYDLRLDVRTGFCQLNRHIDLDCGFLCSHNGWYYYAYGPNQLLQILQHKDPYNPLPVKDLFRDILEPYKDKIRDTDNYYILRMRKKEV